MGTEIKFPLKNGRILRLGIEAKIPNSASRTDLAGAAEGLGHRKPVAPLRLERGVLLRCRWSFWVLAVAVGLGSHYAPSKSSEDENLDPSSNGGTFGVGGSM